MRITLDVITDALNCAADEKKALEGRIENLAGKLRKLNLILARETRINAKVEIVTDWELPELAIEAIYQAKQQLAREMVDEIIQKDLFVLEIDERNPVRRLKAELRVLRPEKARETV